MSERYFYSEAFQKRSEELLDLAFNHVPLYKEWKKFDLGPKADLDRRFDHLPILTKADMRSHFPLGLMPEDKNLEEGLKNDEVEYTFTSGTTSEKVINIWYQDWWDASEKASWKLNKTLRELSYPQKQAKLASSLNVGINCEEDLPLDHRILGNTLYLNEKTSIIQWQEKHYQRMADELNSYQPVILEANPSLLALLACWALDHKVKICSPKAIVFTFEFPSALSLRNIRKVFTDSAFVSSYGSTETGFVMEQCEDGLLHQNTEYCRIDFLPLKEKYGGPDLGEIAVSTFHNPWNVIIRFDVGDLVRLHKGSDCKCGQKEGLVAEAIEGRVGNVTFTPKGGLVTTKMLDDKLAEVKELRDYHLEQDTKDTYVIQAVIEPKADKSEAKQKIAKILAAVYPGGQFEVEIVNGLLPGPAGKFRRTQTNFAFDEKELVK